MCISRAAWGALILLAFGCSSQVELCPDSADEGECGGEEPEIRIHNEALHASTATSSRLIVHGRATVGAGTIVASSTDPTAQCRDSTCHVQPGAVVTLQAAAAQGVMFSRWRGCSDSTSPTITITAIHASEICTAEFVVRVIAAGSYELAPNGIPLQVFARGAVRETEASYLVPYGANVVVSVPEEFTGRWTPGITGSWAVCVPEPYTGTSVFLPHVTRETGCHADLIPLIEVSWTVEPARAGRVYGELPEACARSRCRVPLYSSVALQARPNPGYQFSHWTGCSTATTERIWAGGASSEHCTAVFVRKGAAQFQGLGDLPGGEFASYATDVSDDGTVVVGDSRSYGGQEAFRWTPEKGLAGLGGPQGHAEDVSPDGRHVTGSIDDPQLGGPWGVIWTAGASYTLLGSTDVSVPPPPLGLFVTMGTDVRNDGTVYATCTQYGSYGNSIACRVSASGQVGLSPVGSQVNQILAADDNENVAGFQVPSRDGGFGTRAAFNGTVLGSDGYPADAVCIRPHDCRSEARAFAMAGAVIVGTSAIPPPNVFGASEELLRDTAWVSTPDEGMQRLPDLLDGEEASGAFDLSADGRVIGGFGHDAQGRRALLWIDRVPRRLEDLVREAGGDVPSGWTLREVVALSEDARTLVGNGTNPQGAPEAFRVVLRTEP